MDFEPITESGPLVAELRARIARDGPITFRDFMDAALYHPLYGYYSTHSGAMTRVGDYVTSPEVHPVFGALVARQIREMWDVMSRPERFDVVEAGGGTGALARDVLRSQAAREPEFAAALRYRIVERSEALARAQRATLVEAGVDVGAVDWGGTLPRGITGCVLSNELLDALPVHRVVRSGGELREVYVTVEGRRFADTLGPLSDEALRRPFDDVGALPGEGCYAEVGLDAVAWMRDAARSVERGYVLTFDYGYEARELYAPWRRDGTLLCFYRQTASSDPYQRIGKQDMTASVDFTALRGAGEAEGLRTLGWTDQAAFLTRLGIAEGVAAAARDAGQMEEYFARRRVVLDLLDPARLGRVKVLLQGRGVPDAALRGFSDA
ncbi:MAG TPA: SAM-dependent methyltransferase [Dehalococcoidia bacterium]|nr:SAM-dependent methyltransferase [Dehalococcoidia bacterium]